VEGSGPKWRPVVRQVRTAETAPYRSEEEEPWDVGVLNLCFRWLFPFFKQVQKGFPRSAHGQSIISLHVVWVHFQFNVFPNESVHVYSFREKNFVSFNSINQDHIIKLHVLSHIINHGHVSIALPIIIRVALQEY